MTWDFESSSERPPARIVSLVPSLTETLFALGFNSEVVGITKFCVEPAEAVASITKVGGTKNPDIRAILKLEPELVIANAEENRREDIERIRAGGIPVFTTYPRTVPGAVESILRNGTGARARGGRCGAGQGSHARGERNRGGARSVEQTAAASFLPDLEEAVDVIQRRHLCA